MWKFAGDTTVSEIVLPSKQSALQQAVDFISTWSQDNCRNLLRQLKRAGICASDIVLFYCSTIGSVLEYAFQVFHLSLPFYLSEELERIQQCALSTIFPYASYNSALKEAGIPLFTTGECHYRLIFLMTLLLTLITSSQVCSHQKLITIGSCAAIESSTCQCAKRSALKNLLLLAIA